MVITCQFLLLCIVFMYCMSQFANTVFVVVDAG